MLYYALNKKIWRIIITLNFWNFFIEIQARKTKESFLSYIECCKLKNTIILNQIIDCLTRDWIKSTWYATAFDTNKAVPFDDAFKSV